MVREEVSALQQLGDEVDVHVVLHETEVVELLEQTNNGSVSHVIT